MEPENKKKIENLKRKGKRGAARLVFGRTGLVFLLLILQILVMIGIFQILGEYLVYGVVGYMAFTVGIVLIIINRRENPAFQLAWIVPVVLIPIFGGMMYLYVELELSSRIVNRRLRHLSNETKEYCTQNTQVLEELKKENPAEATFASYMEHFAQAPVYYCENVKYFPSGEAKFAEMIRRLKAAKKFIFMEYFIVSEGYMWGTILKILEQKVREGVEVRFMYDGMCSIMLLPYDYPKKLQAMGIQCRMFSPIRPVLSTVQNNRDHRKILVIDGETAFTGGINLADEYINRKERFGHWKDTAVMIEGAAVRSFTLMFLQMWNIPERGEHWETYLSDVRQTEKSGGGYVIPYGDSPVDQENVGELVYMDIINRASRYVHIMTPYLILDHEMITALTFAAKRGVDVKIIMPHIPDKKYAFMLAKTYYGVLLEAGVQIYEYTPGFVHAKVFTCDDCRGVVGTINMDYRSLYLHFECAAYFYHVPEIIRMEEDFNRTLGKCQKVTMQDVRARSIWNKFGGRVLRLFAPLM